MRERYGPRAAAVVLTALVIANVGTLCAEFAGVAAGMRPARRHEPLRQRAARRARPCPRWSCASSFRRVEHVLLALSSVFVAYVISGFLAHPDWGEAREGAVVPSLPLTRDAILVAVATVGTTLAPWGLAFIQSYAVDKRLNVARPRYERVDVIAGAVLTGVIGLFVVVACAATLHPRAATSTTQRRGAGSNRSPAAAATLLRLGLLGAALLAAAIVPALDRLLDRRGPRRPGRPRRQLLRRRRSSTAPTALVIAIAAADRADPRRAADPDPVPHPGVERRAAARDPAVPACAGAGRRADGRARARPSGANRSPASPWP